MVLLRKGQKRSCLALAPRETSGLKASFERLNLTYELLIYHSDS